MSDQTSDLFESIAQDAIRAAEEIARLTKRIAWLEESDRMVTASPTFAARAIKQFNRQLIRAESAEKEVASLREEIARLKAEIKELQFASWCGAEDGNPCRRAPPCSEHQLRAAEMGVKP